MKRVALLGVLGATGACTSLFLSFRQDGGLMLHSYEYTRDWEESASVAYDVCVFDHVYGGF